MVLEFIKNGYFIKIRHFDPYGTHTEHDILYEYIGEDTSKAWEIDMPEHKLTTFKCLHRLSIEDRITEVCELVKIIKDLIPK